MAKIIGNTTATSVPVADWAQIDPKKADYIKNKPFYEINTVVSQYLLDEATFTATTPSPRVENRTVYQTTVNVNKICDHPADLIGLTFMVDFDGEVYECVAESLSGYAAFGNLCLIGDDFLPMFIEPFCIELGHKSSENTYYAFISVEDQNEHTISIKAPDVVTNEIQQLDEKFIPDTIARVSDIEGVISSDVDGKISAHNSSETAHSDIRTTIIELSGLIGDKSVSEQITETLSRVLPKITTVTLSAANWVGDTSPWSQVMAINCVTANSKVDFQPTAEQVDEMQDNDIAFIAENDEGVVTAYAIYNKPEVDYEMQVLITEVQVV